MLAERKRKDEGGVRKIHRCDRGPEVRVRVRVRVRPRVRVRSRVRTDAMVRVPKLTVAS